MTLLSSCSSLYFLYQAGRGQLKLLNRGKPLQEVIEDPRTDPALSKLLQSLPEIKKYGENAGLKPTPNYREYVQLDQDAVVYVVTVSDELEFKPKIFRFPIVGSFNYLGWFDQKDAREFAESFEKRGYDVDVRGAGAFSTLGWFRDPLLSSMIPKAQNGISITAFPELVNVLLHESVHATLYLKNQSYFNESLASFLADVLTERYFKEHGGADRPDYLEFKKNRSHWEGVRARMARAYLELRAIYDSKESVEKKRNLKNLYLQSLQAELSFKRKITNATLIQFQTYDPGDQGFSDLFKKTNEDVRTFLRLLSKLTQEDFKHPQMEELRGVIEKVYSR